MHPTVSFELGPHDYKALVRYACSFPKGPSRGWARVLGVLAGGAASLVALRFIDSPLSFMVGMLVIMVLLWVILKLVMRWQQPNPGGAILCKYDVALGAEAVEIKTPSWQTRLAWSGIVSVDETPEHVFFRIEKAAAYMVPKRAFPTPEALNSFLDFARAHVPPAVAAARP
jgi:hypothetical protein